MITKEEFKEHNGLLIADLRDPANKQAQGHLRVGDAYCCLGRACEVFRKETSNGKWESPITSTSFTVFVFYSKHSLGMDQFKTTPPGEVAEWFGWLTPNPTITADDRGGGLTMIALNDVQKKTFPQIADTLELYVADRLLHWEEGQI